MPHNLEAEQALLGALMFDNGVFERLSDRLRGSHFYEPFHQRLFDAIEDHIRQGMLAEPTILMERFKQDPAFQEFGGLRYFADLVDRAPPAANAPDYARVVYDTALRRDLIRIGGEIIKEAPNPDVPADEQIEQAEQTLYSLAETGKPSSGFVSFSHALSCAVQMAAEAYQREGKLAGLATGLHDLDRKLGGLHPSDLLILAGRPSMGKTALATNMAFNVARAYQWEPTPEGRKTVNGGVVAFYSLEMSAEQLAMRILADASGVSSDKLRKGEIDASDFGKLRDAAVEIGGSVRDHRRPQGPGQGAERPDHRPVAAVASGRTARRQAAPAVGPAGVRLDRTGRRLRDVRLSRELLSGPGRAARRH